MPKGGPRPGSGRKPGSKNTKTADFQMRVAAAGITPLEYMLQVLRDPKSDTMQKMDAAKAAAPYVHARLNAVDMTAKIEKDVSALTDAELLSIAAASRSDSSEAEGYTGVAH